ncbi:MAG: hypothetical protein LBU89_13530 [Fibromonadaceae bacterium]|jgi:hypothetical protein|nr:hypothetical protein [Fibromonadaceae bacterium]
MKRITKKIFGFVGFLLSVWVFGKSATAGVTIGPDDFAVRSKHNTGFVDLTKFARTGEFARKNGNQFALACIGYESARNCYRIDGTCTYNIDTTYFYSC